MTMTFNEKVSKWYELTNEIKGTAIRDKYKEQIEEIAGQVKEDFLMVGNEDEAK